MKDPNAKPGMTIKILALGKNQDGTIDPAEKYMVGKTAKIVFIDDIGQIHHNLSGVALIPGVDTYELTD